MPIQFEDAVGSVVLENIKLTAGAGGHAMARTHLAGADFDNLVGKAAASGFARREGILDAAMAKWVEDIRYADADAARSVERIVGHPTAESSANLAGGLATAGILLKALYSQPPSGFTESPQNPS